MAGKKNPEKAGWYAAKVSRDPLPPGALPGTKSALERRCAPIDRPLTQMQRDLVKALAEGNNLTSAAARADYASPAAAKLALRQPNVQTALANEREKFAEASQMTRKKVMDGFLEAIDMAKLMAEPATMVSGWREIAKMCGFMEPTKRQIEITLSGNIALTKMNQLSDAELLKLITPDVQQEIVQQVEAIEHEEEAASDAEYHEQAATPPGPTTPLDALIDATKEIDE